MKCALEVEQDTVNAQKIQLDEHRKQYELLQEKDANTIQAITKYVALAFFKPRAPPERWLAKAAYLSHHAVVIVVIIIIYSIDII